MDSEVLFLFTECYVALLYKTAHIRQSDITTEPMLGRSMAITH